MPDPSKTKSESTPASVVVIEIPSLVHEALKRRAQAAGKDIADFLHEAYGIDRHEITDLEELVELAAQPRERSFRMYGRDFKFRLRALTSDEVSELDLFTSNIIPPMDKGTGLPNENDPNYRATLEKAIRMKRAVSLSKSLLSFKIKGNTPQEMADYLYKKLPPGLIAELWTAVYSLTSDPIENALFT